MVSYNPALPWRAKSMDFQETSMFKMLVTAGVAVLMTACAAPSPSAGNDPLRSARGSTPAGESTAAEMGFHGPVYRTNKPDGPN